jgi:L-lactate dehydrogenase complex protein LldG
MPASAANDSREKILRRIREALQETAPPRHLGHHHGPEQPSDPTDHTVDLTKVAELAQPAQHWLPPVPDDLEGRIRLFMEISETLKTTVRRFPDKIAAASALLALVREEGWKRIFTHQHPLTQAVCAELEGEGRELRYTDKGYEKSDMEAADVGITGCEALIAQTASILISPRSSGGRVLSVLVPHHIVVATTKEIVRDLQGGFHRLRENHGAILPRYFSLITGPSRTGDIERILVLGAHGPKKLTVFLLEEDL